MTADQKGQEAVRLIKSRAGKNSYTQGSDRGYVFGKPEGASRGYGDCSSTVREVMKRVLGTDIGGNTSAQVANHGKGVFVEDNRDGKRTFPTLGLLKPGDCVYYKGTPGNTWGVGHVEMVTGENECYGHGSGEGPTRKSSLKAYSQSRTGDRKYLCVIRWIKDDATSGQDTTAPTIYPAKPTPEATPAPVHGVRITGGLVNLRTGPGTAFSIATAAKQGDVFESVDASGWRPILADGKLLWVSESLSQRV